MALKTLSFRHPNGKSFSLPLEETTRVGSFISRLKSENVLNSDLSYIIKTVSGIDVPENASFDKYSDSSYVILDSSSVSYQTTVNTPDDDDEFVPPPVNASFYQLGIFVIDGSGSMNEKITMNMTRSEAVDIALKATFIKFKVSRKKECFSFSVVAFGDYSQQVLSIQKAENCTPNDDYSPVHFFNNGLGSNSTNIYTGLSKAYEIAKKFLDNKTSKILHKVAIVVLSDGMCHNSSETRAIADKIKQIQDIEIYCCHLQGGLPDNNAQILLKNVASSLDNYKTVTDENTIRNFFVSSISSSSGFTIV